MKLYAKLTLLKRTDRVFLRNHVIPYIARISKRKALNIGVHYYTYDLHQTMLSHGFDLYTADIDESKRRWGIGSKHEVCGAAELADKFPDGFFEFILLFGVLGYGINTQKDRYKSFLSIHRILEDDAILLIAWDENMSADPFNDEYFSNLFERRLDIFGGKRRRISNGMVWQDGSPSCKIFDFVSKKHKG